MAASKAQRIGIWIIAAFMAVGTIGSFAIIILANSNGQKDQERITTLTAEYEKAQADYQAKSDAQAKELSAQYYSTFSQYESRPATFDASSVTTLKSEDLLVGSGDAITADSTFAAYYIGWTPDGKVFDGSLSEGTLKSPFTVTPTSSVIEGWRAGTLGMKIGGVRELSIPAEQAYGATGSGESIAPNTPLKFVIMAIPAPEAIPQPEMSPELLKYYTTGRL